MGKRITHEGVKISLNSLIKLSGGVGNITSTKSRVAAATSIE